MFSSIFGKRRSSPVDNDTPPIPGHKADDSFEIVNPSPPRGGLYPNVYPGAPSVFPQRPAPQPPLAVTRVTPDQNFHYLQGVPFNMSKELRMASNKDSIASEIGDLLAFLTSRVNINSYNYDFSLERSVLKEL